MLLITSFILLFLIISFGFLYHKYLTACIFFLVCCLLMTGVNAAERENNVSSKNYMITLNHRVFPPKMKDLNFNKIILFGDSRMEYISKKSDTLHIPINFLFDAKGGATIKWARDNGVPKLEEILKDNNKNYRYHVVFNMGVNDIQEDINIANRVREYFAIYKRLALKNPNVEFYILSVNPVNDDILNKKKYNRRTNARVESFNKHIINLINSNKIHNIRYCDSYHKLDFHLPDGLHYDDDTDQQIIDYIANECLNVIDFKIL